MLKAKQRIRIEWGNCDPSGLVFNPNYYIWMDQGAHQLIEVSEYPIAETLTNTRFRGCALVSSGMNYRKQAYYNDRIELTSEVEKFGNKSFTMRHEFTKDEILLADGFEFRVWGCTDPEQPQRLIAERIPDEFRACLSVEAFYDTTV